MRIIILFSLIAAGIHLLSCASDTKPASLNPNGDSELALHMRAMYDDALQMKEALARGEMPEPSINHARLLSASATEPEKAASDTYRVWAESYLATVEAIQNGDMELAPALYDNLVNNCMGCHTDLCPGPRVRIKKLFI